MAEFKLIDNIKDITNELFSDVIIYTIAEPGAMGFPRLMEFVTKSGECFYLVYGNEKGEMPYSIIKSSFRALQDCFWNGSADGEDADDTEIVIYPPGNKATASTKVSTGWRHIYLGFGNHICVKEALYQAFIDYIGDGDLLNWDEHIDAFLEKIS